MPPSVRKLTPFEKRLRRIHRLRALGHDPAASNCLWSRAEDRSSGRKAVCAPCAQLQDKFPSLAQGELTQR